MLLCALDEGAFNLKRLCQRKRVNIKLANNKPILTLYWMLLKDRSTNRHTCVYTLPFFQSSKQIWITQLLTDSNPCSHMGGETVAGTIIELCSISMPTTGSTPTGFAHFMNDSSDHRRTLVPPCVNGDIAIRTILYMVAVNWLRTFHCCFPKCWFTVLPLMTCIPLQLFLYLYGNMLM